jgi:hypothetical protein
MSKVLQTGASYLAYLTIWQRLQLYVWAFTNQRKVAAFIDAHQYGHSARYAYDKALRTI